MRAGSSLSRWRLATRTSVAASMRSTSTLVIVFQKARVVFGSTRCFGSPSSETMATSLAPDLHDLEVLRGNRRVRLGEQQRLVGGDLRARDLDDLRRQAAAVVERDEAARAEQTLEPAIAHEECPLVVLDDNLELEQHDTVSNQSVFFSHAYDDRSKQVAGRSPTPRPRASA